MRKILAIAAATMLASCGGGGSSPPNPTLGGPAPTPTPTPTPSPTPTPTTVAFAEEFNAAQLDRSVWTPEGPDFWVNNELQAYVDSSQTIQIRQGVAGADGGVLVLKPVFTPGQDTRTDRNADFSSGRIDTRGKYDFTYGRAEARIKLADGAGVWPAFWLLGNDTWPATGEIDIMEYVGELGWTSVALHGSGYSGDTPLAERFFFPGGQSVTDWHVYSVEWSADSISFEVDGASFYSVARSQVEQFGPWAFDTPKHIVLNFALGGDYPFGVNGVIVPYRGLPQSTVDRVKSGEVEMLVDWVRVTPPQ